MIIYKLYKESLSITAHRQRVDDKKIDFYSFDQQTAKIIVQIKSPGDGKTLEAVQDVLIALERGGKKAVHNMTVEDYNENLVSFVLPDNIISQSGSFLCGIYLDYGNNKSLDVGYFRINLKQSLIDKDLPAMEQFYVQSFEELKDDIIKRSSDLKAIIDGIDTDVADKLQTLDDLAEDYAQKAADLEATYAPRLTEVTTQLVQTQRDFNAAVGAITEDSEVILARGEEETLGVRLDGVDDKDAEQDERLNQLKTKDNQLEVAVAKSSKTLSDLAKTISSVNVNQEAKQTISTDAQIASLPVNAGNGVLDATLKGLTATNLIKNGDFSEGLTGWSAWRDGTYTPTSKGLEIRRNSDVHRDVGVHTDITGTRISDLLYIRVTGNLHIGRLLFQARDYGGFNNPRTMRPALTALGTFEESFLFTSDRDNLRLILFDFTANMSVYLYSIKLINLTQTFGAGNEPTKEQCDIIFDSYFNGTKSFTPGRVRSTSPYEPYTETVQYVEPVKLNRLPNGVADEITADGDFIQRVGVNEDDELYQLAEPIVHKNVTTGKLIAHPKGTVYFEQYQADAGMYFDGLTTTNTSHAIKALESLSVVDFMTGNEVRLDVSKAVITGNSFTHPDLSDGDLVFLTYEFSAPGPNGRKTLSFYDSRYTIKDDVTGDFYKWSIKVANGVPQITVEGV